MAEKRRKLHVQYNEDSANKLLRYVKYFASFHLSGNTKYVELLAFLTRCTVFCDVREGFIDKLLRRCKLGTPTAFDSRLVTSIVTTQYALEDHVGHVMILLTYFLLLSGDHSLAHRARC